MPEFKLDKKWNLLGAIVNDREMSRSDAAVAKYLLDLPSIRDRGLCWPSFEAIAVATWQTVRNAQKCIGRLERAGYFQVERGGGKRHTNQYFPIARTANGNSTNASSMNEGSTKALPETTNASASNSEREFQLLQLKDFSERNTGSVSTETAPFACAPAPGRLASLEEVAYFIFWKRYRMPGHGGMTATQVADLLNDAGVKKPEPFIRQTAWTAKDVGRVQKRWLDKERLDRLVADDAAGF